MKQKTIIISIIGFILFLFVFLFLEEKIQALVFTNTSQQIINSQCVENISMNDKLCIGKTTSIFLKIYGINDIYYKKNFNSIRFYGNIEILGFRLPGYSINYATGKYINLNNDFLPQYNKNNGGYWIEKKYNDNMVFIKDSF